MMTRIRDRSFGESALPIQFVLLLIRCEKSSVVVDRMQVQVGNAFVLAARPYDLSGLQGCKDAVRRSRGFFHLRTPRQYGPQRNDAQDCGQSGIWEVRGQRGKQSSTRQNSPSDIPEPFFNRIQYHGVLKGAGPNDSPNLVPLKFWTSIFG
ncbi:unnamed protein product [Cylicocyclus nassatus]|uniref:Uncharacterized protein n=1 Tax=Cylicocyclus nassatus TaxID=53992 RepID=A0AA36LZA9_CYLNA|nr:unnamed protein product [Cylicocyclus nassatus]